MKKDRLLKKPSLYAYRVRPKLDYIILLISHLGAGAPIAYKAEVLAAKLGKLGIGVRTLVEGGVSRDFLEKGRGGITWRCCTHAAVSGLGCSCWIVPVA